MTPAIQSVKRRSLGAAVFLLFSVTLAARGFTMDPFRITVSLSGTLITSRPADIADATSSIVVHNNVYECLVRYAASGQVVEPSIAESWDIQDGGRAWIFTLRDGVRFHDGSILTADDVVDCLRSNKRFEGTVEKVDSRRVRLSFSTKRAGLLESLSQVHFAITKRGAGDRLLGTGPFTITEWNPAKKVLIDAFADYWGGKAPMRGVTFFCSVEPTQGVAMMRRGDIDVVDIVPPALAVEVAADPNLTLSSLEGVNMCFLQLNAAHPPFDDAEFRQALRTAIDGGNVLKTIYKGQAVAPRNFLPPAIGGAPIDGFEAVFNVAEAQQIVAKHLGSKGRTFKMVGLPFPRPYCPEPEAMARLIAGYLERAGLTIEYIPTRSFNEYFQYVHGTDFDIALGGWVIDSCDPDDLFGSLFTIGGMKPVLTNAWRHPAFESLILEARGTVSVKKRGELYREASSIIAAECPIIILAHTNKLSASKKGVAGLTFSPTGELRFGAVKKKSRALDASM